MIPETLRRLPDIISIADQVITVSPSSVRPARRLTNLLIVEHQQGGSRRERRIRVFNGLRRLCPSAKGGCIPSEGLRLLKTGLHGFVA